MAARGRHLERALDVLLASNHGQLGRLLARRRRRARRAVHAPRLRPLANFGERAEAAHLDRLGEPRLGDVRGRDYGGGDAQVRAHRDQRKHAVDVAQVAVERELAEQRHLFEPVGHLLRGDEDRDRDRQVVERPLLAHVGRREVYGDAAQREFDQQALTTTRVLVFTILGIIAVLIAGLIVNVVILGMLAAVEPAS